MAIPAPQRSVFVTNLAWFVMVIGILAMVSALVQGALVLVTDFLPGPVGDKEAQAGAGVRQLLFFVFYGLYIAVCAMLTLVGRGLLRRRNGARVLLLALLWVGIAKCAVFVAIALGVLGLSITNSRGGDGIAGIATMLAIVIAVLAVGIAFGALLWWIQRRLRTVETRREFGAA